MTCKIFTKIYLECDECLDRAVYTGVTDKDIDQHLRMLAEKDGWKFTDIGETFCPKCSIGFTLSWDEAQEAMQLGYTVTNNSNVALQQQDGRGWFEYHLNKAGKTVCRSGNSANIMDEEYKADWRVVRRE